ncbi:MAG: response regulator [Betaproteobacteria bacterium]|nr:response regulator [Betaproteobacteria bacterium]
MTYQPPSIANALEAARKTSPKTTTGTKPKILLIDDEERVLNALQLVFRGHYEVFTATEGSKALEILRAQHIHVVITDQRMPAMTGVEFLRHAREISPNTVRILLTGFSDLSAIIDSVNEGEVFRFLNKPWGNRELLSVIGEAGEVALALERGATPGKAASRPAKDTSGGLRTVLVRTASPELFQQIKAALPASVRLLHAKDIKSTLDVLASEPVAVLTAHWDERCIGNPEEILLFRLLKREQPALLSILLMESADSEEVITLINRARIYRYLPMPSKPARIAFFIESALSQYKRQSDHPELLVQQKVVIPQEESLPESLVARVRSIGKLLQE